MNTQSLPKEGQRVQIDIDLCRQMQAYFIEMTKVRCHNDSECETYIKQLVDEDEAFFQKLEKENPIVSRLIDSRVVTLQFEDGQSLDINPRVISRIIDPVDQPLQ